MLLRALETGEIQPIGAQGVRQVDVRVLAATDADLSAAAAAGRFRFPLYQRLTAHAIRVPPLRQRAPDVPLLMLHFLRRELAALGKELPDGDADRPWLSSELVVRALRHSWPGNVRELSNFCRELALSSANRRVARPGPVFEAVLPPARVEPAPLAVGPAPAAAPASGGSVDEATLVATLRANQWKIAATARALGIAKNTLYQLMDQCGRIRKARDLGPEEISTAFAEHSGDLPAMAARLEVSERGLKLRMRELGIG
jgi:two-component system, NtrC family, nitrogen regulation response regulator GlnG